MKPVLEPDAEPLIACAAWAISVKSGGRIDYVKSTLLIIIQLKRKPANPSPGFA
jgi:hypothetical protein